MRRKRRLKQPQKFTDRHQTKIRFLLTGILNTGFGLGAYPALYYLLANEKIPEMVLMVMQKLPYLNIVMTIPYYLIILTISQIVCIMFAFLTNKFLVFRTQGNYGKEFIKFVIFHFSYFLINLAALPVLVVSVGLNPVIAQTSFAVMVVVSSYFWHSRITFSTKKGI